uniref:Uncharacterized protein n=1 Tax=Neogobius melanostomus TaxID=47308 RepID=A0A8C6U7Y3_9GOBI
MASADRPASSLESLLNLATDPQNPEERWESIQGFYQRVNQQTNGPQVAVRLLAHKIQSPQEREALQALTVLEACMNECGKKFHCEVAKFRFLNELIKVLSPKYFGAWSPQKVKERVVEVLYGWTLWLRDQPKIQEAYDMLKKQDIVKKDPKLSCTLMVRPAPQRSSASIFHQDDTAKLLDRLLKSGRPEDLHTANHLIKSTMQAEQERAARVQRREDTLKDVHRSSSQLQELLQRQAESRSNQQPSEEMKGLFEHCDRLRPTLFRLANETVEDDVALSRILQANDALTLAFNAYRAGVSVSAGEQTHVSRLESTTAGQERAADRSPVSSPREVRSYHLIDFSSLDPELSGRAPSPEEGQVRGHTEGRGPTDYPTQKTSYLEELIQLDEEMLFGPEESWEGRSFPSESEASPTHSWSQSHTRPYLELETRANKSELHNVSTPVNSIQASELEPVPLLDRGGVQVSLHFSRDPPMGHPAVAVLVLSMVNTSVLRVSDFCFQAAVPKSMCVKLQPASGSELPPYNPLLPPAALSQVLLLDNPQQKAVRLRYKLSLTHGAQRVDDSGEVSAFPEWSRMIGQ